ADVPAGEEDRLDDEGVGGHRDAAGGDAEGRLVLERGEDVVAEGGQKDAVHELGAEPPAAPVPEDDAIVAADRDRTGEGGGDHRAASASRWMGRGRTWRP